MEEHLKHAATDTAVDTRGELPVFTSSTTLFVYIKNSITRCTVLTRGQTFLSLFRAFQETLQKYASVLDQKFPSTISIASTTINNLAATLTVGSATSTSAIGSYRIPPGEEVNICHVIDTCEYCADTVEALESLIKDKIDLSYKSQVDMSSEQGAFYDVNAKGIRVLVSGLEHRADTIFREMSSMNWSTLDTVGEESPYVRKLHSVIHPFVETLQSLLPSTYFKNFCDKFATAFINLYYSFIIRLKRISDLGTQQLLLDVYNVKTLLLKIPVMQKKSNPSPLPTTTNTSSIIPPALYTKMVTKDISCIEIFLKLVGTPTDQLQEMFLNYWPNGTSLDLQNVMNLKGMKRQEQNFLIENMNFQSRTQKTTHLVASTNTNTNTSNPSDNTSSSSGVISQVAAENLQLLSDKTTKVADKVNSDLSTMRQKVDDFRKSFR